MRGGGGGVVAAYGWKGATVYCEAPPWTHVGSGGDWTAGASFWTAPCLGMASPPSLGAGRIDDGGHGISSLCLGETGRGLVCGPSMDPRRFSWRLVGRGIFLTSAVTGGGGIKYGAGGGGGAGCRRGVRVEKGPRSTVRPHHGQTSVLAAIGRQGHPSGLPLASEWPVRRHWGRRNRRREGGMASSWRTGGKGPRPTVRPLMHPRRFSRRLGGRSIRLDSPWPRNGPSAVTRGGGIDYGRGAGFRRGVQVERATDYCEALPCTHVSWRLGGRGILQDGPWLRNGHSAVSGGGGIDDGGHGISSLCLGETGRGLVCRPSMDPRRFSWRLVGRGIFLDVRRHWWRRNQVQCGGGGGRGVVAAYGWKGAAVYCEAPPWTHVGSGGDWTAGASFWTASSLGMASPPSLGQRDRRREGGMAWSWRTGGKGPRPTVRPLHAPTSVQPAFGRQGHPSGQPLASEWPVRRH